jgi:hypothetical protein
MRLPRGQGLRFNEEMGEKLRCGRLCGVWEVDSDRLLHERRPCEHRWQRQSNWKLHRWLACDAALATVGEYSAEY